jgi:methionyl-tRNA formyltransferase
MNIHPSMLPQLRGADPLFHIADRDYPAFGLSFHKVVPELDAGALFLQTPLPCGPQDTYDSLYFKIIEGIFRFLPHALKSLQQNPVGIPQEGDPTWAVRFRQKFRVLNPEDDFARIKRRSKACYSHHTMITAVEDVLLEFSQCRRFGLRRCLVPGNGSVQKVLLFSVDVCLDGDYVRLKGVRVLGRPWWLTPMLLQTRIKPGQSLVTAADTRALARRTGALP